MSNEHPNKNDHRSGGAVKEGCPYPYYRQRLEVFKIGRGGSIRPPPHISNVSQERGLKFLHNIFMYINYICANFQRNICIMTIKIDQNKFNHYNPLAEMTGSTVKSGNSN